MILTIKGDRYMLAIIGESASGKSSLVKHLINNHGFDNIVIYTTREPRDYEISGIDYYFISKSDFLEMRDNGFFAETAVYHGWYYGSAKEDYIKNVNKKVAVLTPHGIRQLKKNGIDIFVVYINIPRRDRLIKILERGDDIDEAYRRNLSDVGQFDGVEDEADLIIENAGYKKSIPQIAKEILSHIK